VRTHWYIPVDEPLSALLLWHVLIGGMVHMFAGLAAHVVYDWQVKRARMHHSGPEKDRQILLTPRPFPMLDPR